MRTYFFKSHSVPNKPKRNAVFGKEGFNWKNAILPSVYDTDNSFLERFDNWFLSLCKKLRRK